MNADPIRDALVACSMQLANALATGNGRLVSIKLAAGALQDARRALAQGAETPSVPVALVCPHCKVDRLQEPCPGWHPCPMVGSAAIVDEASK